MLSAAARPAAPSALAAAAVSPTRIDLAWRDNSRNESLFLIYGKTDSAARFRFYTKARANSKGVRVNGLSPQTTYQFYLRSWNASGSSALTSKVAATTLDSTSANPATDPAPTAYRGPITISRGGTYTGNWQGLDPNTPAVRIQTSQPVTIINSNIRSRGTLIDARGYAANLTIQNTRGYALNPNVPGRYPGRFLNVDGFTNINIQNNYMEGTSGIYLYGYKGNHTASQTVKVFRNRAKNIDGRYSDGNGGFLAGSGDNYLVQFFQINGVQDLVGAEVAWNEVVNDPGRSRVEDNISIHNTSGIPSSPFRIHNNYIQGAYPANAAGGSYSGGGIMVSDNGSNYVHAFNNQVVSTSNYGIAISSGHDNQFYNNRIIAAGVLRDGTPIASQNVGAYIWNMNGEPTFARNRGYNNVIGWAQGNGRNDAWTPDAAQWANNTSVAGRITLATEAAEWDLWISKLANAAVQVGPQ